ncbi:polysaccharide deacetylase family protein [Aneurinibacillus sp. REN35]|uniref:polysaccharide deacetylase family protein n=1 Tax=Aneurinibacillus sp. REN35 TaxID=3237286 RepID=UPI00352734B4
MRKQLIDLDIPGPKRDYIGYGRNIPKVTWPNNAQVVVNFVISYEEGSEHMKPLGDDENEGMVEIPSSMAPSERDLAVESMYEYGSRVGIWRLQRIFDQLKAPATLFPAAVALERNPEVAAWIKESNHDICAHGWRWEKAWRLTREEEKQRIQWAVESIERTCGIRPVGWYCRYGPSVHTRELLIEQGGFVYDADAYNDELPYFVRVKDKEHLVVPYSQTINDGKFVRPQGYSSPKDFYEALKTNLDFLWEEGKTHPRMMSVGLHPRLIGHPLRASALKDFIEYAQQKKNVWIARRIDIANWWLTHHQTFN